MKGVHSTLDIKNNLISLFEAKVEPHGPFLHLTSYEKGNNSTLVNIKKLNKTINNTLLTKQITPVGS